MLNRRHKATPDDALARRYGGTVTTNENEDAATFHTSPMALPALAAGVDMDSVPEYERPTYVQPAPFMLMFSVFRNALWLTGGSLLALTGAGAIVASRFNMSSR